LILLRIDSIGLLDSSIVPPSEWRYYLSIYYFLMKQFSIIQKAFLWLGIAAVIIAGARWMFMSNMRMSVQFTWGMEVVTSQEVWQETLDVLNTALTEAWYTDFALTKGFKDGYGSLLLQQRFASNDEVAAITDLIQSNLLSSGAITSKDDILEQSVIWPSIGDYITRTAKSALIWGTILMALYILFAFSGMRKVISPLLLAIVTIVTMIFDVSFAGGIYGMLMSMNETVQVDTIFIIALLTVMWYSINDTIVIFDRIRENTLDYLAIDDDKKTKKGKKKTPKAAFDRAEVFDRSLRQTMRRSLATSISTLLVIGAMYFFGTWILKMFAFTLGMWVIAGTYSSIFVAAPLAYLLSGGRGRKVEE